MKQRFRDLLARNRWLKWVPNALTLGNALCGFAAILYTLQVYEKVITGEDSAMLEKIFAEEDSRLAAIVKSIGRKWEAAEDE